MEKENFRVLLDLSDLQDRVHNFVWMLISTIDFKNIADLKNAIKNKLDLDTNEIKLFVNGGLLLEEEKIIILRENDTIEIKYEKSPDSFCHNSSLMETQDRSLNAEKSNGYKVSKHSKKHKRSDGTDLPVDEEYQKTYNTMASMSIFVGGLGVGKDTQKEDLEHEFSRFGNLSKVWVARDPPGFALIDFENDDDANEAIKEMNGATINGAEIVVEVFRSGGQRGSDGGPRYGGDGYSSGGYRRRSPMGRTQHETFLDQILLDEENTLNQLKGNSSCMEVENQRLSLNAENCNGNKSLKHSKKHKSKREISDLPIAEENRTLLQYEALPGSSICSSSVEVENNKSSISSENCNGNKTSKHSKKHKRRNEGDNVNVVEENKDMSLSKKKRKRDVDSLDTFGENEVLNPVLKNISSSKKNKSSYGSITKEVIVSNESDNKVEINKVPVISDVSVSCKITKGTINLEVNEDNKPTDVSVDSFAHGSNCKKRKRKRNRKRKTDANLLGPFMSANISTFQNLIEEDSTPLSSCTDYASIRKHIRFTSPDRESIAKEIETMEPELNCSSSQSEGSPIKAILPPSPKCPSLLENIARATEIAKKIKSKICTSPNSNCLTPSIKTKFLNQFTNQLATTNEFSRNTSSITYNPPGSTNLLSPKPTLNSTIDKVEALTEQKLVDQIPASISEDPVKDSTPSYTDYPLIKVLPSMGTHIAFKLLELGENYSPEVSNYKEGVIKSLNPHSEELEIELINIEVKPGRTGKFENLKEDEDPQEEVIKKVMVPWSSLIEPRLISQNSSK